MQCLLEAPRHLLDAALGIDDTQQAAGSIELDQGAGLFLIYPQPLGDGGLIVVRPLNEPMRRAGAGTGLGHLPR